MNDGAQWIAVEVYVVGCDMQGGSHRIRSRCSNRLERKESDIAHPETFKLEGPMISNLSVDKTKKHTRSNL